jgi:hypothetical protein
MSRGDDVREPARAGYLLGDDVWDEDDEELLPDSWFNITRKGRTINKTFREYLPRRLYVQPDGAVRSQPDASAATAWFLPTPFLTCLHCGVVYTRRDKDDFRKLARLSSEGRSTATTLLSSAAIDEMRDSDLPESAKKLLSFTDNRQDASLQAGHFNDFASVALLRSATAKALPPSPDDEPLTHLNVASAAFRAMDLPQEAYAKNVASYGGARRRNEEALTALLEYRLYEDLRRSWRITQPNLEQCGLLTIDYLDLHELCVDPEPWQAHPVLAACPPEQRERTIRALLDHMRRELAIDAPSLDPEKQGELAKRVNAALNEQWAFADEEARDLRKATRFVVPSDEALPQGGRTLSVRGAAGRFLRSAAAWGCDDGSAIFPLDEAAYEGLLRALLDILVGTNILTDAATRGARAVQIRRDALLWRRGDGSLPPPDPIRGRRMAREATTTRVANRFFSAFYSTPTPAARVIEGREHTGQVPQEEREEREERFRDGKLPVLFCSPTMELGIDIADLNVVHLRNVPPTPANYAQRSGRAGRSGQPALVMTYCSTGSGHDQYFFQRPLDMVAGVVASPQIELANEDLLRAHVHAVWLAAAGIDLARSVLNLLDTGKPGIPLNDDVRAKLALPPATFDACEAACKRILLSRPADLAAATWFDEGWLGETLQEAAQEFERSFDRWRQLYEAANAQFAQANQTITRSHQQILDRDEVEDARRQRDEAERQIALLCNTAKGQRDSDFYPYRYLASEGFLPGYNFPRLPVRAFLPVGSNEGTFLARPRFLALTEFGPQNIIYHEGRKFRVVRTLLPAGDAQKQLLRAKLCRACGYFHRGADADVCDQCGAMLSTSTAETLTSLFEMTTATTQRVERITCEEEERVREGFTLSTHYQFSRDHAGLRKVEAAVRDPADGFGLAYGPAATIWRINHGWRRARQEGFALDMRRGIWGRNAADEGDGDDLGGAVVRQGVKLLVQDTRNLLVVLPPPAVAASQEEVASLQFALQRGIEELFQLEEQELSSEVIGAGNRIIYWEAAEGGAGVLRRLVEEPDALARVARKALEICHFDPDDGAELETVGECARACYRCLLSYGNQPVHGQLNRRAVRDLLLAIAHTTVERIGSAKSGATAATDGAPALSPHAQRVLDYILAHGGRAPDSILAPRAGHQPHFGYNPSYSILCPEPGEEVAAMRDDLEDAGYTVVVVAPSDDVAARLGSFRFWKAS